jgi:tetratricopeptide (TPR) repeat protein
MPELKADGGISACLEPNVVGAYVEGRLDTAERARVEAHLASCDDCHDLVMEVSRTLRDVPSSRPENGLAPFAETEDRTVVRFRSPRRAALIGVLAAAAVLVLIAGTSRLWRADRAAGADPRLALLVEAVADDRRIDGRLTGGFRYGALRSPKRSATTDENPLLRAAAAEIETSATSDPSDRNVHASGIARLLLGDYNRSIEALAEAQRLAPTNAGYANDFAVAYLARANATGQSPDLATALTLAERAVALEPNLAEAWFTRAAVLEKMGRTGEAVIAWNRYVELERDPAWRADAERRRNALAAPPQK